MFIAFGVLFLGVGLSGVARGGMSFEWRGQLAFAPAFMLVGLIFLIVAFLRPEKTFERLARRKKRFWR